MTVNISLPPFSWSFKSADADEPLSDSLLDFLSNRKSSNFSEISIGLASKKSAPASIYEPPLTMVDYLALLSSSTEKRPVNIDPPLEITKYIITSQMLYPMIGNTQEDFMKVLDEVSSKVIEIAKRYDVPYLVRRHGLFDSNYYGKPQSILRLALASARANGKNTIDTSWVMKAFDDYCLPNIESNFDSWPEIFTSKGIEIVSLKEELDRQVLRFITDNETRETGVGFHLIQEHFINRNEIELGESVRRLREYGKIREIKHNVFRSVPLE